MTAVVSDARQILNHPKMREAFEVYLVKIQDTSNFEPNMLASMKRFDKLLSVEKDQLYRYVTDSSEFEDFKNTREYRNFKNGKKKCALWMLLLIIVILFAVSQNMDRLT